MRIFATLFRRWRLLAGVVVIVIMIMLAAAFFLLSSQAHAAPEQPIAFNHEVMVQTGIPCLFCHTDAIRSPVAGMPSVEKCMGCHKIIVTNSPEIKKLAGYWKRQEPIPWVRVNQLPRFVYFSHRPHIAAGLNCERCHGDVGHMTVDHPGVTMDMGWCLSCHAQQSNAQQLQDCIVCHQ
jgi:Cytochrome c7 and related cytochrome c